MSTRNALRTCLLATYVVVWGVTAGAAEQTDVPIVSRTVATDAGASGASGAAAQPVESGQAPQAVQTSKSADSSTTTYANARYGYAIDYPERLLRPEPEAADGDGRVFSAKAGSGQVAVWGRYNATGDTAEQLSHAEQADTCAAVPASYEVNRRDWVAFSCETAEHEIVYQKMVMHDDTVAFVEFTYPPTEQASWAPVIKAMSDSLRIEAAP